MRPIDSATQASGIYALARLDGAPVAGRDAADLGFRIDEPKICEARGVDGRAPDAVHEARDPGKLTIVVGHIEQADALRERLGLLPGNSLALLARAALTRFGHEMPATVPGEWSLLHWEGSGQLVLMTSAARRDRLFYAVAGPRVAVAPDLFRLSRLSWVGKELDEAGLLFALGRGRLRDGRGDRTMLARVRQLEPGCSVAITSHGVEKFSADVFPKQEPWRGTVDDAIEESSTLLRTILREKLARTARPAVMLSGGLDSSTLACFAAQERHGDQPLRLFTSVAPPGSGLPDEAAFADAVADRLALTSQHLFPPEEANIYRPPDYILTGASGPPLPTRHCLTETFQAACRAHGVTMLLDGTWGELTLTGRRSSDHSHHGLVSLLRWLRRPLASNRGAVESAFHVRLSKGKLGALPEAIRSQLARPADESAALPSDELWGYHPGAAKALRHTNEFYADAVRVEFPFRDLRLLRLFASFPSNIMDFGKIGRAPARRMTAGLLPDGIRLRNSGRPASPDHLLRMRRQAPIARARIATFRAAEVDEWLDLDWLDSGLARISRHGPGDYGDSNQVQLTAIVAEFLSWWRLQS